MSSLSGIEKIMAALEADQAKLDRYEAALDDIRRATHEHDPCNGTLNFIRELVNRAKALNTPTTEGDE